MGSDLYIATHPTRLAILREIQRTGPIYVSRVTKKLNENGFDVSKRIVSYHLSRLIQYGLVTGEFKLMNPPKGHAMAAKYFVLTDKSKAFLSKLKDL